jgi:hypothetical protein
MALLVVIFLSYVYIILHSFQLEYKRVLVEINLKLKKGILFVI